jgi:hypothetical protein
MSEPSQPPTPEEWRRFLGFRPPSDPRQRRMMFAGVLIGIAVSAVAWGLFFDVMTASVVPLLLVIGGKLVGGLVCTALPRWRPLGQGLLVSLGVGLLIFLGRCAMSIG